MSALTSNGHKPLSELMDSSKQLAQVVAAYFRNLPKTISSHILPDPKPYAYRPFKNAGDIRLCYLQAGGGDDEIRIVLEHCSIDKLPAYEALSYCWGDHSDTLRVFCEGKYIEVTRNLHDALKRLRWDDEDWQRVIWADNICINQNDNSEKSEQLLVMPEIYSRALDVVCWVGNAAEECADGIALLKRCDAAFDDAALKAELVVHFRYLMIGSQDSAEVRSLRAFIRLPWFRRAWILQEIYVSYDTSPVIWCGHLVLELKSFCRAFVSIGTTLAGSVAAVLFGDAMRPVMTVLALFTEHITKGNKLSHLVAECSYREAKHHQDKIFCLLGILAKQNVFYPKPDYDMPWEQITKTYTRAMIHNERDLSALYFIRQQTEMDVRPTWTLDPTKLDLNPLPEFACSSSKSEKYHATLGSVPIVAPLEAPEDDRLGLHGLAFGTITATDCWADCTIRTDCWNDKWPSVLSQCKTQCEALNLPDRYGLSDEPMLKALLRTMAADDCILWCVDAKRLSTSGEDIYRDYLARRALVMDAHDEEELASMGDHTRETLSQTARELFGDVVEALSGKPFQQHCSQRSAAWLELTVVRHFLGCIGYIEKRQLIQTDRGYLGVALPHARVGDHICLLMGGCVPLVLRPAGLSGEYQLIGEAYIHGLMDGEGMAEYNRLTSEHPDRDGRTWLNMYRIV